MTCPKCRSRRIDSEYHQSGSMCYLSETKERKSEKHMHYKCKDCKHDWTGPAKEK